MKGGVVSRKGREGSSDGKWQATRDENHGALDVDLVNILKTLQ